MPLGTRADGINQTIIPGPHRAATRSSSTPRRRWWWSGGDEPRPRQTVQPGVHADGIYSDIVGVMKGVADIVASMRRNPQGIRFKDLCTVCDWYFGEPRKSSGSHRVYKTPWPGDPRVNIQNKRGQAKVYQVRQVLQAIDRMEVEDDPRT
jgi:hypothetical protein